MSVFPFIVGCGRSGTTLLRSMFDSHPDMAIPPETYFVVRLARNRPRYERKGSLDVELFGRDLMRQGGFKRMGLAEDAVWKWLRTQQPTTYADAIRNVYSLYASEQGKSRYGDKTPIYILSVPLLSRLFAEAKFVHIIRDGRDVAQSFLDGGWAQRVEDAAMYWKLQVTRGRKAGRQLGPERYREVSYEHLVDDPPAVLRELSGFLELEYDDRMLEYRESARRWADASRQPERHRNLLQKPATMRDWRTQMSEEDLVIAERLTGDLLRELGYEVGGGPATIRALFEARRRWARWQGRRVGHRLKSLIAAPR